MGHHRRSRRVGAGAGDRLLSEGTAVVIDTDPGIDDALALLLATRWPRCDLRAVSVVYGNTTLERGVRNARLLLERGPSQAPVHAGWDRPLAKPLVTAKETHGPEGLGDHEPAPAPRAQPNADGLLDALAAAGGPVTLITLGPFTNLALALRTDAARVRASVRRHVAMGATLDARGTANPIAEFNVWCDPEAVDEVLRAGLGTEFVGLDVTRKLMLPAAAVRKLATHADADARWLGRLLGFYVRFHEDAEGLAGAVINDPLAVALALEPSWGRLERVRVRVDTAEGPARGRTSRAGAGPGIPEAFFYLDFELGRVHDLLLEHLFGRWLSRADFKP